MIGDYSQGEYSLKCLESLKMRPAGILGDRVIDDRVCNKQRGGYNSQVERAKDKQTVRYLHTVAYQTFNNE